jgi:hypothetical protein
VGDGGGSIAVVMDAAAVSPSNPSATQRLLGHCHLLDGRKGEPTAAARLEALLGPEFARRLVAALSGARL